MVTFLVTFGGSLSLKVSLSVHNIKSTKKSWHSSDDQIPPLGKAKILRVFEAFVPLI